AKGALRDIPARPSRGAEAGQSHGLARRAVARLPPATRRQSAALPPGNNVGTPASPTRRSATALSPLDETPKTIWMLRRTTAVSNGRSNRRRPVALRVIRPNALSDNEPLPGPGNSPRGPINLDRPTTTRLANEQRPRTGRLDIGQAPAHTAGTK